MKTFALVVMAVGAVLLVAIVVVLAAFALRDRSLRQRLALRMPPDPPPLPPPPPERVVNRSASSGPVKEAPPTPLERWDGALRQALQRGFDAWWRGRTTCPGCQGPFTIHPPRDHRSLRTNTGYGFSYWTQELSCNACSYRTSFMHTDAGPAQPLALDVDPGRAPPRRWNLGSEGRVFATLRSDAEGRLVGEPIPDANGLDRIRLSIALHMLSEAAFAVPPEGLAPDVAASTLASVSSQLLFMHGVPVVSDAPGPGADAVDPLDDVKPAT